MQTLCNKLPPNVTWSFEINSWITTLVRRVVKKRPSPFGAVSFEKLAALDVSQCIWEFRALRFVVAPPQPWPLPLLWKFVIKTQQLTVSLLELTKTDHEFQGTAHSLVHLSAFFPFWSSFLTSRGCVLRDSNNWLIIDSITSVTGSR